MKKVEFIKQYNELRTKGYKPLTASKSCILPVGEYTGIVINDTFGVKKIDSLSKGFFAIGGECLSEVETGSKKVKVSASFGAELLDTIVNGSKVSLSVVKSTNEKYPDTRFCNIVSVN